MINKDIYSNISISDEMKEELINDVKKGKRTSNFRFKYSTALMALGIVGVLGFSGIGVSAAYISYKNRVQSMSVEEQEAYKEILATDDSLAKDDSLTRSLSDEEWNRYLALEDEYYTEGRFPADSARYVEKLEDIADSEVAFVKEINKVHIPEGELSDEQLLQLIDYEAKYIYVIEENAIENGYIEDTEAVSTASESTAPESTASESTVPESTASESTAPESTASESTAPEFIASEASEQELKQKAIELVKEYYDVDVDDSWNYIFSENKFSEMDEEVDIDPRWDCYSITFEESDAPNATCYQISIPIEEDGVFAINCSGKNYYANVNDYSREEAEQFADKGQEAVISFVKEKYGLGDPDRVEITGFENLDGDSIECADITYDLYYGEEIVTVSWNITNEMIYTVIGANIFK